MSNFDPHSDRCDDFQKRRIVRLLQVREQSKEIARNLRTKANEEKLRQITIVKNAKKKEFDNVKQKSIDALRIDHKKSVDNIGLGHEAVDDENLAHEEWKNQQNYNNTKAIHRGNEAVSILRKKKSLENKNKPLLKSKNDSKTLNKNTPIIGKADVITVDILENKENDNGCINYNPITSNDEIVIKDLSSNVPISLKHTNDDVLLEKECAKNDIVPEKLIQDHLCDCPSSSNVPFQVNNVPKYISTQNNPKNDMEPINMISKFIQNRDNILKECNSNKNVQETDSVNELMSIRDLILQSKQFNTEYKDKYQSYLNVQQDCDIKGIKKRHPDLMPVQDWINRPCYKIPKAHSSRKILRSNHKKSKFGKSFHSKHTPKWQIGTNKLNFNEKFVESYDHLNRFNKSLAVDNRLLVEHLPKERKSAYEYAREETNNVNQLLASIDAMQMDKKMKMRGQKAMGKVRAEKDYDCLLKELDTLDMAQKMLNQQIDRSIPPPIKTSQKRTPNRLHAWTPAQSSLNIADCNNVQKNVEESNATLHQVLESNGIKNESDIRNIFQLLEDQKVTLKKELMKIVNKSNDNNKKEVISRQTNTSENEDHFKAVKNKHKIKRKLHRIDSSQTNEELKTSTSKLTHSVSSTSRNSVSLEGLQILIELKKDKKITANVINKKTEKFKSVESLSNSELSLKAAKVLSSHTEKDDKISFHKSDSSASTTYMSLPDKITTNLELYQKKQIYNVKNVESNEIIDIYNAPTCRNSATSIPDQNNIVLQSNTKKEKCIGTDSSIESEPINKYFASKRENRSSKLVLKNYIRQLLEMSNSKLNKMEIDVSEISTPSSSVVNMSSNMTAQIKVPDLESNKLLDKMQKLKQFIKENYTLLDELNECFSSNDPNLIKSKMSRSSSLNSQNSVTKINKAPNKVPSKELNKNIEPNKVEIESQQIFNVDIPRIISLNNSKSSISDESLVNKPESIKDIDLDDKIVPIVSPRCNRLTGGGEVDLNLDTQVDLKETSDNKVDEFIPFFANIPKPVDLIDSTSILKSPNSHINKDVFRRPKPPVVLNKCTVNTEILPHELSTIMEVDTPRTLRNITSSKACDVSLSSLNTVKSDVDKNESDHTKNVSLPKFDDLDIDAKVKSFISYKDFVKKTKADKSNSDLEFSELTLLNNLLDTNEINFSDNRNRDKLNLSYQDSSSTDSSSGELVKHMLKSVIDKQSNNKDKLKISGLTEIKHSSDRETPEDFVDNLNSMLRNFGMTWGVSELKKMRKSALSVSETTSSEKLASLDNLSKSSTCNSLDLIDFLDNIKSKDKLMRDHNVSDFKEFDLMQQKINELRSKIDIVKKDLDKSQSDKKISQDETEGSKDKTQHRTSTPVLNTAKSLQSSSTSSSHRNSNILFGIESDLSSVKNLSNSGRNSSDDHEPLSVPNVSLKFNKLFDNSSKDDK